MLLSNIKYKGAHAKHFYYEDCPSKLDVGEAVRLLSVEGVKPENAPVLYRSKYGFYVIAQDILIPYIISDKKTNHNLMQKDYGDYGRAYFTSNYIKAIDYFHIMCGKELPKDEKSEKKRKVAEKKEPKLNPDGTPKKRGKAPGPMTTIKAKGIVYKKAKNEELNPELLTEAIAYLNVKKELKFLHKYKKFLG